MTDVPKNSEMDPAVVSGGAEQQPTPEQVKSEEKLKPEISSFFATDAVSISNFFKGLRDAGITHFLPADQERAAELMKLNDPLGDRLWSIVSQGNQPGPLHYWMWKAVQERLKNVSGDRFNPQTVETEKLFEDLIHFTQEKIKSDDKDEKRAAQNWLRLGIAWLIEKRAMDPWKVISRLDDLFFDKISEAKTAANKLIKGGRSSEFRNAVAIYVLAKETVTSAQSQSRQERIVASDLRERLTRTTTEMENLKSRLARIENEFTEMSAKYQDAQKQYDIDRQHWGHNLTEVKASHNVLMQRHVRSDLQDALDALEIEPPALKVAISRLKSALKMIDEATSD